MMDPHWLPELIPWAQPKETWQQYEERLFRVFCREFMNEQPIIFYDEPVRFRRIPYTGIYPEAFIHLTTCHQDDGGERLPDPLRSERIAWPRPVIENHQSCHVCGYVSCTKPWVWKNKKKVKIYLPNQHYLVVLSKRSDYWVLVTAYHLEHGHSIERVENEYRSQFSEIIQ